MRAEISTSFRPNGGYRLISVEVLASTWFAYRRKTIRLFDLRVWLAAQEVAARRCLVKDNTPTSLSLQEFQKLTGLSRNRVRQSLNRLLEIKLLDWTDGSLSITGNSIPHFLDGVNKLSENVKIPNGKRKIPFPRRMIRLLAGGARPALIATVFGHLIYGLYIRQGECSSRGRVKTSWIADTFGVGHRRVKEARHDLIEMGWLIPLPTDQRALNRWGGHFLINLDWSRHGVRESVRPLAVPKLAPPPAQIEPKLAPPLSYEKPLSGKENYQKPASSGPSGVSSHEKIKCQKPDVKNVVIEDLKDTGRLLELHGQAVDIGLVTTSERDRLRFVGAAEHARAVGTKNPCGLFVRLVRCALWNFLTQDDEDAANVRLKRHLFRTPVAVEVPRSSPARSREFLSEDAILVREVRAAAAGARFRGDAFPLLKRSKPEWTRERWDNALAELTCSV